MQPKSVFVWNRGFVHKMCSNYATPKSNDGIFGTITVLFHQWDPAEPTEFLLPGFRLTPVFHLPLQKKKSVGQTAQPRHGGTALQPPSVQAAHHVFLFFPPLSTAPFGPPRE